MHNLSLEHSYTVSCTVVSCTLKLCIKLPLNAVFYGLNKLFLLNGVHSVVLCEAALSSSLGKCILCVGVSSFS